MHVNEKPIENHFPEWENEVFGFGYGTGEIHTLQALKAFMTTIENEHAYDYTKLEVALTPPVAWLLINMLCDANILEYGTSPRYGWLTTQGKALHAFVNSKSIDELYTFCTQEALDDCTPTFCNCGPMEYSKTKICHNPFW